ncbi:uncharacterized protein [Amphiura filiformis]|uniref:uncharacterized protein n=1 Tax=Amphiura filiformis TaxID=82378 RepID=UPI003B21B571
MASAYVSGDISTNNASSKTDLDLKDILRESEIRACKKTKAGFEIITKNGDVYKLKEKTKGGKKLEWFLGKIFRKKISKSNECTNQAPFGVYRTYEFETRNNASLQDFKYSHHQRAFNDDNDDQNDEYENVFLEMYESSSRPDIPPLPLIHHQSMSSSDDEMDIYDDRIYVNMFGIPNSSRPKTSVSGYSSKEASSIPPSLPERPKPTESTPCYVSTSSQKEYNDDDGFEATEYLHDMTIRATDPSEEVSSTHRQSTCMSREGNILSLYDAINDTNNAHASDSKDRCEGNERPGVPEISVNDAAAVSDATSVNDDITISPSKTTTKVTAGQGDTALHGLLSMTNRESSIHRLYTKIKSTPYGDNVSTEQHNEEIVNTCSNFGAQEPSSTDNLKIYEFGMHGYG